MPVAHTLYVQQTPAMDSFNQPITREEDILNNILRDKAASWKHDYYSCTKTMHDAPFARAFQDARLQKNILKKLDEALDALAEKIEKGRTPGEEKKTVAEINAMEAEYTDIYKEKCAQMILLERAEAMRHEAEWKRYMEAKRYEMIHTARNRFMLDGNIEGLREGIAHAVKHSDELKAMS